jgi:signal transduction histidine kinase
VNQSVTPHKASTRYKPNVRGGRIVVVDDQDSSRFWRKSVLEAAGHTVLEASSVAEARILIEEFRPELAILDVNLPDGSGLDLSRRLKEDDDTQGVMVLQMSASFTTADDQARGLDAGADAYLVDPVPANVFLATVHALLRVSRAENAVKHALDMEQQARLDAESANQLKDDFLATLSHELRTPINAIIGWLDLIKRMAMDDEAHTRALAVIERNALAQAALIEDLLDVSRISKGHVQLRLEPVRLALVVRAALETVGPAASAKDISLSSSLNDGGVQVRGDAPRLQQVVWNLLANAVKFTPQGGKVEVGLRTEGSWAVITVSDTGRGIGPELLPRVFDQFYRSTQTVGPGEGLGLGLTIAKQLVERHGGTLTVSSPGADMGTTFVLRLPQLDVHA